VTDRVALLRRGARLESVTVAYNALEGGVAIVAGLAAGSVALTGFGIDSVIEVASGAVLWWRLRAELGAARVGAAVEGGRRVGQASCSSPSRPTSWQSRGVSSSLAIGPERASWGSCSQRSH